MTGPHVTIRARNIILAALAMLYLAACAYSIVTTLGWINRPFPGFLIGENNMVGILYRSHWTGFPNGINIRDILLEADGKKIESYEDVDKIIQGRAPGDIVSYKVMRKDGSETTLQIPVDRFTMNDYLFLFPCFMLVGLVLYSAGIMVFFLRPNDPAARRILLFSVMLGLSDACLAEYYTGHTLILPALTYPLIGPAVILISLYFPVEIKRKWPFHLIMLMVLVPVFFINHRFIKDILLLRWLSVIITLESYSLRFLGIGIMLYSFYRSRDPRVRQQGKLVVFGFLMAFLVIVSIFINAIFLHKMNIIWTFLPWIIIPVTLSYAILKHNLFDVDLLIRRSVSYILVCGIAIALFFILVTGLSLLLQQVTGQSSRIAAVLSTLAMVAAFRPLRARTETIIDRRFFRDNYEYTTTIRKASSILASIIDLGQLLRRLLETVLEAIKIENGVILLKSENEKDFQPIISAGFEKNQGLESMEATHPLSRLLQESGKAIQRNDVEELPEFTADRDEILRLMDHFQAALLIPVIYEQNMIGILALGRKKSGAGYSSEDMEILRTLMVQTAVSIENAKKIESLKKMVELDTSYRELKRLDELKDNLLSMVSHDLRTPMTSIRGYASILLERIDRLNVERKKRYLHIIMTESDRLTRLINDLLDLQRLEAGELVLNLEGVDVAAIVEESLDSFTGAALAKKQELKRCLTPGKAMVNADRDRLSQVIANLLSNATKFTPEGGTIEVKLELQEYDGSPGVKVSVKDNGPGVTVEEQSRLFSKFQQAGAGGIKKEQGSGLGLALARQIIELHGGRIGVESSPGEGAEFFLFLKLTGGEQL